MKTVIFESNLIEPLRSRSETDAQTCVNRHRFIGIRQKLCLVCMNDYAHLSLRPWKFKTPSKYSTIGTVVCSPSIMVPKAQSRAPIPRRAEEVRPSSGGPEHVIVPLENAAGLSFSSCAFTNIKMFSDAFTSRFTRMPLQPLVLQRSTE